MRTQRLRRGGSKRSGSNRLRSEGRRLSRRPRLERLTDRWLMAGDLTNEANPLDVNADEAVTASDALVIVNHLGRSFSSGEGESAPSVMYLDVNSDSSVTAADALMVINGLSRQSYAAPELPAETVASSSMTSGGGHVDIDVKGKDVHVTFKGREDVLFLHNIGPETLRISYGEGEYRDVPLKDDLFVNIDGHDLSVVLGGEYYYPFDSVDELPPAEGENGDDPQVRGVHVPDDLIVRVSGHRNSFQMYFTHVGDNFVYHGSDGDEYVEIGSGTEIDDLAKVITRSGDDVVFFGGGGMMDGNNVTDRNDGDNSDNEPIGARVGGDFIADLGDGHDVMDFYYAEIGDDGKVLGDDGDDVLIHERLRVRDDFFAYGEDGNDVLEAFSVEVGDDAHLKLGDDDDEAILAMVRVGDVAHVDGGDDDDVLRADTATIEADKLRVKRFEETAPIGVS